MTQTFLTQIELARRWKMSPRTLERWRTVGTGPAFLKIAGRALYSLEAIEAHERRRATGLTARTAGATGTPRVC